MRRMTDLDIDLESESGMKTGEVALELTGSTSLMIATLISRHIIELRSVCKYLDAVGVKLVFTENKLYLCGQWRSACNAGKLSSEDIEHLLASCPWTDAWRRVID